MIKILPQDLINQIAAGEVIERPASVVKELVENSLDAGARAIVLEIENGGLSLIKVVDDGSGMDRADAVLSVAQHATSKITSVDDLFKINTFGFRGEALASISSVSDFTLITKKSDSLVGTQVTVKDNKTTVSEVGCPTGTTVIVRDLFYNIPARKKYLKTAVTEYNHIVDLFLNYVVVHQNINWKLIHNNKVVYNFAVNGVWLNRLFEVFGKEISEHLLEVKHAAVGLNIKGFIGKPQIARNNRKLQYLFVNSRPIQDFIAARQIRDAYGSLLMNNLYPVCVLNLEIEPRYVDVNVHPRKLEVRYSNPQRIYSALYQAVVETLDKNELTKIILTSSIGFNQPKTFNFGENKNLSRSFNFSSSKNYKLTSISPVQFATALNFNREMIQPDSKNFRVIGQINNAYIILETSDSIKIIDQHAASERIQLEKIIKEWRERQIKKQKLLLPENIEFSSQEASRLRDKLEILDKFGFELSELSQNFFMINAIPIIFINREYKDVLKQLVGQVIENTDILINNETDNPSQCQLAIFQMMACKSAIKFGDKLQPEEIRGLLEQLEKCENKYTCAHGRPCVLEFSYDDLEKMFKRKNI